MNDRTHMRDTAKALLIASAILILCGGLIGLGFAAGVSFANSELAPLLGFMRPTPAPPTAAQAGDREKQFSLFWEAWDLLKANFYGELPAIPDASRAAIRGLLQSLGDPNTTILDPKVAKQVNEDITGEIQGIGATVRTDENGYFVIVQPYEGSPAAKAGLLPADIVLEVDGREVQGLSTAEVISYIRGPKGTTVRLLIFRPSTQERLTFSVVRDRISIPNIEVKVLDDSIAYIRLYEFNAMSVQQVRDALRSALSLKPNGIIFDLRNNPGGLLDAAVRIGSEFVGSGNIAEERMRDGSVQQFPARRGGLATDPALPLVVLINQASASASEIVAGAVQDTGRGMLVGQRTYGKASVQLPHTLSDGSQLRITIAHWFTPGGRDITKEGLKPDVEVVLTADDFRAGRDPQLERAVQIIQERAAGKK